MITRGNDIELQRLRSEVQELSGALHISMRMAEAWRDECIRQGIWSDELREAWRVLDDIHHRIALPRVDAGREDAA